MVQFDKEIVLTAKISDLDRLQDWLGIVLDEHECSAKICSQIAVVTEEIFVNICSYAYKGGDGAINIQVGMNGSQLVMRFEDSGIHFNPLEHKTPDVTLSIADRGIGGLGIFLIRKWMDDVRYDRIDGKNQLTLYKSIKSGKKAE